MSAPIGPDGLSPLARDMLNNVRVDPRTTRDRADVGSVVLDFWDEIEEAERLRELGTWGLYELARSVERTETELGVRRDDLSLTTSQRDELQAAWERAEIARAERANEHPHLNATALLAMTSALDAFVPDLVLVARRVLIRMRVEEGLPPEIAGRADRGPHVERIVEEIHARQPAPPPLERGAPERYERVLADVGLNAPVEQPLPRDLATALRELTALRNVLVHRAGRVDKKAKQAAASLRYDLGDLVRMSRADYRTYSAAICAYGSSICHRFWGQTSEELDLSDWRDHYRLNA